MRRWAHVAVAVGLLGCSHRGPPTLAPAVATPEARSVVPPPEPKPTPSPASLILSVAPMPSDAACTFATTGTFELLLAGDGDPFRLEGAATVVVPNGVYEHVFVEVDVGYARIRGRSDRGHASPREGFLQLSPTVFASSDWWSSHAVETTGDEGGVVFELRAVAPAFALPEPVSARFSCEQLTSHPEGQLPRSGPRPMYRLGLGTGDSVELYATAKGDHVVATIRAGRHRVHTGRRRGDRVEARVVAGGIIFDGWLAMNAIPDWDPKALARTKAAAAQASTAPTARLFGGAFESRSGEVVDSGSTPHDHAWGGERPPPRTESLVCPDGPVLVLRRGGSRYAVGTVKSEAVIEVEEAGDEGEARIHGTRFELRPEDRARCRPAP